MNTSLGTFDSISGALRQIQPLLTQITQAGSLEELAHSIYEVLLKDLGFQSTGFYFYVPEESRFRLLLAKGLTAEEVEEAEQTAMDRHPGWVLKNKRTYLTHKDEQELTHFQKRLGLVSRLYCPVLFKNECIGTIGVASSEVNAFNENHVSFIEFICQIAAVAYENIIHAHELRRNQERMDQAISALKFGIWDWDLEHNVLIWDDFMYELYEQPKESFSGAFEAFEKTLHPEDVNRIKIELDQCFQERKDFQSEFRVITREGRIKRIAASGKCTYSPEGKATRLVGANWDVTEARENEIRLLQTSKMSSLGEMSSGIAHEINNPLAIIHGKTQQVKKLLDSHQPQYERIQKLLTDIDQTVGRISRIIKGLQSFSRDSNFDPLEIKGLKPLLEETLSFCLNRFRHHGIDFRIDPFSDSLDLECRPPQISQVLLNLLNNAFDAVNLPEIPETSKRVDLGVRDLGAMIEITVSDYGSGIGESVREKIMEPFFTTKEVGKGTGLGLSISLGIVRAHHGTLTLESLKNPTRFKLTLPKRQAYASA